MPLQPETSQATPLTPQVLERLVQELMEEGTGDRWLSRRHEPRCELQAAVELTAPDPASPTKQVYAYCRNISIHGLGLRTREPLPLHATVTVRLDLAGEVYVGRARVEHCTQSVGGYTVGLGFVFDE